MLKHSLQVSAVVRLFLALGLAITPTFVWATSLPLTGVGGAAAGGSCTPGTAATNFLARTSGLSGTETAAYCTLINGLVTDGIITGNLSGAAGCGSVLDGLYIVATNNTTTAALNLCGTSFSLVTHGSLTFTADVGYTGDGSTGYLDTQWTPSSSAVNYTLNSASMFAYIQSTTALSTSVIMGSEDPGGVTFGFMVPVQSGNFFWDANGATFPSFANTNPQGAWVWSRNASSTTSSVYLNAATTKANAVADTSVSLPAESVFLFALNTAPVGTPASFTNYQASAFAFGKGLTSTQAFALNNRINTYMNALGHSVF